MSDIKWVLLVDPDRTAAGTEYWLKSRFLDIETVRALDGERALELMRSREFAVIILCGAMPQKTGPEVFLEFQATKGLTVNQQTPVIFLTSESYDSEMMKPVMPWLTGRMGVFWVPRNDRNTNSFLSYQLAITRALVLRPQTGEETMISAEQADQARKAG